MAGAMKATELRIERRTFDGELAAYWEANVLRQRSTLLIWHAAPLTPLVYPRRGFSTPLQRHQLGWVWLDRRFTVEIELSPAGGLERAIARICLPPNVRGEIVSIIELGLTVTVAPGPVVTVDDDEFQEAANDYGYDPQLRATAWSAVEAVRTLLTNGEGPFGPDLTKMYTLALKQYAARRE
jgi:protein associated with RNAse G/E